MQRRKNEFDDSELAFRYTAGRPCLDLVATLGERNHRDIERIGDPERLGAWAEKSGFKLGAGTVGRAALSKAIRLREAIYALANARIAGLPAASAAISKINAFAEHPPLAMRLSGDGTACEWVTNATSAEMFSTLARDAIELFGGELAERVRRCAEPTCNMIFLDQSRPGTRKWCSMTGSGCGNRAKKAAFRRRQSRKMDA